MLSTPETDVQHYRQADNLGAGFEFEKRAAACHLATLLAILFASIRFLLAAPIRAFQIGAFITAFPIWLVMALLMTTVVKPNLEAVLRGRFTFE